MKQSIQLVDPEVVRRTADILGGASAAAQALACVERDHAGAAVIVERTTPAGRSLVVVPQADWDAMLAEAEADAAPTVAPSSAA